MIRGIVTQVIEGLIKRFSASGRTDETIEDREYFQHYGFTSRPLAGAEIIIINDDNHYLAIASDDRNYRVAVENGEVAIYTDEGDKIHFKRDKTIHVVSGNKLIADVTNEVDINTKAVKINASVSVDVDTQTITINATTSADIETGTMNIDAETSATTTSPSVIINASTKCQVNSSEVNLGGDRDGLRALIDERIIEFFNAHAHPFGGSSVNSGGPGAQMTVFDETLMAIFNYHVHPITVPGGTTGAPGTGMSLANHATTRVKAK